METLFNALKGTPWWVYVLFFYLLSIGIRALKPRIMSLSRIFILPLIFIFWSIWNLTSKFQGGMDILIWLIFLVIGMIAGWGIIQRFKIRADHKKMLIGMPGGPVILILILAIFSIKYFFGYVRATHQEISPMIHSFDIIASGLITGIFFGRTFVILKKFTKAKHEKLKKT